MGKIERADVSRIKERVAQHTRGPWHVNPKAPESYYDDVSVLRHDGLVVAIVYCNGDISPEEVKANARLIAAAPEHLRALKQIAEGRWVGADGKRYTIAEPSTVEQKIAHAALSKSGA